MQATPCQSLVDSCKGSRVHARLLWQPCLTFQFSISATGFTSLLLFVSAIALPRVWTTAARPLLNYSDLLHADILAGLGFLTYHTDSRGARKFGQKVGYCWDPIEDEHCTNSCTTAAVRQSPPERPPHTPYKRWATSLLRASQAKALCRPGCPVLAASTWCWSKRYVSQRQDPV